jgi:hypothetical protein
MAKRRLNRFERYLAWFRSQPQNQPEMSFDAADVLWASQQHLIFRRPGTQFLAGPFPTKEEAERALKLAVMPPKGTA